MDNDYDEYDESGDDEFLSSDVESFVDDDDLEEEPVLINQEFDAQYNGYEYDDEYDDEYGDKYEDNGDSGDSGDSDNEFIQEEDVEGRAEIGAFERVAYDNILGKNIDITNKKEKFIQIVDNITLLLKDEFIGNVGRKEILDKINNLKNVTYKNPVLYVLGYIASNEGKSLEEANLKKAYLILQSNENDDRFSNISKPDILRYARLWINLN